MSKERLHSDNMLREKFKSFEGDIPMSDWDLIAERLDKKLRFAWIWWAAIPLLLVGALSFILFFGTNHTDKNKRITIVKETNKSSKDVIDNSESIPNVNDEVSKDNGILGDKPKNKSIQIAVNPKLNNPLSKLEIKLQNNFEANPNTGVEFQFIEIISKTIPSFSVNFNHEVLNVPYLSLNKPEKTTLPPTRKITYEVGLSFTPAMGLEAIKINKPRSIHDGFTDAVNGGSGLGSGINNGIHAQLNFSPKWFVRGGLYRIDYSVSHDYEYTVDSVPRVNGDNEITAYFPQNSVYYKYNGKSSVKYLSIPILLGNRTYIGNSWGLESKLGLTLSYLLNASGQMVNPTSLELESLDGNNSLKKLNSGVSISTGLFFKTKNNLNFTVEPNFSTLIGSAQKKDYAIKTRKYNYGINLNVNYVLKRNK